MKIRVKPSKEQQALIEELIKDEKVKNALVNFGADMWQQGFYRRFCTGDFCNICRLRYV